MLEFLFVKVLKCLVVRSRFGRGIIGIVLVLSTQAVWAHGPTRAIGMLVFHPTTSTAMLDLRVGIDLYGRTTDLDGDHLIPPDEWSKAASSVEKIMREGVALAAGETSDSFHIRSLKVELLDTFEVQSLFEFDAPETTSSYQLRLGFMKKITGLEPTQLSVWRDEKMIRPVELIWFHKPLVIPASAVTGKK